MKWSQAMGAIALGIAMHTANAGEVFVAPEPIIIGSPEFKKICEAVHNKTGLLLDGQEICEISTDDQKSWIPLENAVAFAKTAMAPENPLVTGTAWGAALVATGAAVWYMRRRSKKPQNETEKAGEQHWNRLESASPRDDILPESASLADDELNVDTCLSQQAPLYDGPVMVVDVEMEELESVLNDVRHSQEERDTAGTLQQQVQSWTFEPAEVTEVPTELIPEASIDSWGVREPTPKVSVAPESVESLVPTEPAELTPTRVVEKTPVLDPIDDMYGDEIPEEKPIVKTEEKPHIQSRLVPERLMKVSSLRATARSVLQQKKAPEINGSKIKNPLTPATRHVLSGYKVPWTKNHTLDAQTPAKKSTPQHIDNTPLEPIKTVSWAQHIVDYMVEFVNKNWWKQDMIPEIKESISFIFSNTERVIAEYEQAMAEYFTHYWYEGDSTFENIQDYFTKCTLSEEDKNVLRPFLEDIGRACLSLQLNKDWRKNKEWNPVIWHIPGVIKRTEVYISGWAEHDNGLVMLKGIEMAISQIANNLATLEKSRDQFLEYKEKQGVNPHTIPNSKS